MTNHQPRPAIRRRHDERLRGSKWLKLRASVLRANPLCVDCDRRGITSAATEVDHIDGDSLNNSWSNLQGLCHECHTAKTLRERGIEPRQRIGADGYPEDVCDAI